MAIMQHKKLLVPKLVSFNPRTKTGYVRGGTKAFVEKGTRITRGLANWNKFWEIRKLARNSPYYIKRLSSRAKEIRRILMKAGIRVEKEMMDLKNGTSLFEKEGYEPGSEEGIILFGRDFKRHMENIENIVAKMHSHGIIHGHLHAGNFAITTVGQIILLDLGRARILKLTSKRSAWLFMRFLKERHTVANAVAHIAINSMPEVKKIELLSYYQSHTRMLNTFKGMIDEHIVNNYSKELKNIFGLNEINE